MHGFNFVIFVAVLHKKPQTITNKQVLRITGNGQNSFVMLGEFWPDGGSMEKVTESLNSRGVFLSGAESVPEVLCLCE